MELGLARLVAVVAENASVQMPVWKRHRSFFKLSINPRPGRRHIHHGLTADWTSVLPVLKHAFLTRQVKEVAARGHCGAYGGAMNVFHADGAVGLGAVLHTLVRVFFLKHRQQV